MGRAKFVLKQKIRNEKSCPLFRENHIFTNNNISMEDVKTDDTGNGEETKEETTEETTEENKE